MESDSFNIPCSETSIYLVDPDLNISQSIDLLNLLSSCLSASKILDLSPEAKHELLAQIDSGVREGSHRLSTIHGLVHCIACNKAPLEVLVSCGHGYCRVCLKQSIERQTFNKIVLNRYESQEEGLISARCIQCSLGFSSKDIGIVFENIKELEIDAKVREIAVDCDRNGWFKCITCDKRRGIDMLSQDFCRHMCKICIAQQIINSNSNKCKICSKILNFLEFCNETTGCCKCTKEKFFVGDYVQEICPGFLYCINCTMETLDHNKCFCHDREIDFREKIYLYSNIMKTCGQCKAEKYCVAFLRHSCCEFNICFACAAETDNCYGCGNLQTRYDKNQIEAFNSRILRSSQVIFK